MAPKRVLPSKLAALASLNAQRETAREVSSSITVNDGSRGRAGAPSLAQVSRSSAPPTSSRALCLDANVTEVLGACVFEVQVSPSVMRKLGLTARHLLRIKSTVDEVICEVVLGSKISGNCVGLHPATSAILVDRDVSISLVDEAPPPAQLAVFDVVYDDDELATIKSIVVSQLHPLQLASLIRLQCTGHVLSVGMVFTLVVATHALRVELKQLKHKDATAATTSSSLSCAFLVGSTEICVSLSPTASGSRSSTVADDSTTREAGTERVSGVHVLFTGSSGTGKTYEVNREVALRLQKVPSLHVLKLDVASFHSQLSRGSVTSATAIRELFQDARNRSPALLVCDDLHLLMPSTASPAASSWGAAQTAYAFCQEMDACRDGGSNCDVSVVASASSSADLDPGIVMHHRLGSTVRVLDVPANSDERLAVLAKVFDNGGNDFSNALRTVAAHAHGCSQRDLARLKQLALSECFTRTGTLTELSSADIQSASRRLRPTALRNMEVAVPNVTWNDIGGSVAAKKALQDCVEWCLGKNKWLFEQFHMSPPRGVLLYGPPGCSKTMLAKALANESKMNFISVKGPEVFSKWVGDSEKAVREIFRKARAVAPCVVFVDELDGMCGHRGAGGVSDRVISQFLTELDGLPSAMSNKSESIILVAATNRPENIDGAVLRPGRIDQKVYVGLPDHDERLAIASLHVKKMPCSQDVTPQYIADKTEGYSGAEVVAVCKESAFQALDRTFAAESVTLIDVDAALKKVTPRISQKDVDWYKTWASRKN